MPNGCWYVSVAVALALGFMCGCSDKPTPPAGSSQPSVPKVPGAPPDAPTANSTSAAKSASPAKSAEELVEQYKAAFASGDKAAIEKLVHWEGGDQQDRDSLLGLILQTGMAGKATIVKATLRSPEERDRRPFQSLPLTHVLEHRNKANDDSSEGGTSVPITQVNGDYYFYLAMPKTSP
jgi:hypothetical protein